MLFWYINLNRRPDRNERMLEALQKAEVPVDKIRRIAAKDREDYNAYRALADAAVKDGFTCFRSEKERHIQFQANTWSCLRALRDISNQDKTILLSEDDYYLKITYPHLQEILTEIPDFHIAMMAYTRIRRICPDYSKHWLKGIPASGAGMNIFTPTGAKWLLETCTAHFPKTPETVIRDLYPQCPGGVYALNAEAQDKFLEWGGFGSDLDTQMMYQGTTKNEEHNRGGSNSNKMLSTYSKEKGAK